MRDEPTTATARETSRGRTGGRPRPLGSDWRDERGVALIIVLLATMLLTALAVSLVLLTSSETLLTANYRNSHEALYAADAAVERVVQDLLTVPQWNDLLSAGLQSSFTEGPTTVTLDDGTRVDVTRERDRVQAETNRLNIWGPNNPVWQVYAYGPMSSMLPEGVPTGAFVMVLVGDDPSEDDSNPSIDSNGVLTLHAEAWGSGGARKVVEVTVARTASTEIERGYIAQRGQEEWNQRSRKAAVQTPGKSLTEMRMNLGGGGMVTQ
ncbi:MAG TPA: pilus assembly PilX N-terminal domain-containing protein [Vicinamibacterales bacterium]|nr:pilus assembly PilX N-terminal domain-containing protein [Vicinamibacterales bacterium]